MVLRRGGVVVFPTDTCYGLGVDATSDAAVERLYELKGRKRGKPVHVAVSGLAMAERYVMLDERARKLARAFLPGPLTLVLKERGVLARALLSGGETLGLRIPDSDFVQTLTERVGVPVTATSANKSGDPAPYSIGEVHASFSEDFERIDLVVDAGALPHTAPSTLVDLTDNQVVILREGPISRADIESVLS